MYENGFYSLISKPTRITTHSAILIDHAWTNIFNYPIHSGIIVHSIADPMPKILSIQLKSPYVEDIHIKQRQFGTAIIAKFVETLVNFDKHEILQCNDANNAYNKFIEMFDSKYSESFYLHSSNSKQTKMKWYDSELQEVYRKKQLLYKKFLRKPNASNKKSLQ